jgi:hypothetical protein
MKGYGYLMGIHKVSHMEKTIAMHFKQWNAHACRHLFFEMPCCILCFVIVLSPKNKGMMILGWKSKTF